jgi:hypothetical protein
MNSAMTIDVARQLVARPEVADAKDDTAKVTAMYLTLFQRSPRPEEVALAERFIASAETLTPPDNSGKPVVAQTTEMGYQKGKAANKPRPNAKRRPIPSKRAEQAARNARAPIENVGDLVSRAPLTPWELYAQALLCSNEFVYVN